MGTGALGPWLYAARIGAFSRRRNTGASRMPIEKTCNYCKKPGLHWRNTGEGWRLHDAQGNKHICGKRPFIPSYADEYERPTFRGPEFEFDE